MGWSETRCARASKPNSETLLSEELGSHGHAIEALIARNPESNGLTCQKGGESVALDPQLVARVSFRIFIN